MALIKCRECGKKVSETLEKCPHCGVILDESICPKCKKSINKDMEACDNCGYILKEDRKEKYKKFFGNYSKKVKDFISKYFKKYKKIIIIVLILLITLITVIQVNQNNFSKNERYALKCTESLKSYLKVPDSIKLENDILVINALSTFTFIDYTASNLYGVPSKDTAIFKGYIYLGEYEGGAKIGASPEDKLDFANAKLEYALYRANGDRENTSSEMVNYKKIARKLHIDYKK